MANCTSCGRELPALTVGNFSTQCRECQAREASVLPVTQAAPAVPAVSKFSLTTILVGINAAIFVVMVLTGVSPIQPTSAQLLKWGADWGPLSLGTQPWRILTSNYIHIGIIHIGFNMWCLFSLGAMAQKIFDRWTYLLVYTATGIAGSVASLWWHPTVVGAGASGAIFGLAGALLSALYLGKLPIAKQAIQSTVRSLLIFAGYNLLYGLRSGVDNAAHIGGFASGLVLGAFLSQHLTGPKEDRQQWRNYALVMTILLLSGSMFYLRHEHKELSGNPISYDDIDAYQKIVAALDRKDYPGAVTAAQRFVQLNPKSAESHFMLGVAYESAGNPDNAIAEFQEALRLDPKDADAETGLAEAYKAKGMDRESQEASQKAAELKGSK